MPIGDRRENLTRSVASLEASLRVLTKDASHWEWAEIQGWLGTAWLYLPTLDRSARRESLCRAVECLEAEDQALRSWWLSSATEGNLEIAQKLLGHLKRIDEDREE